MSENNYKIVERQLLDPPTQVIRYCLRRNVISRYLFPSLSLPRILCSSTPHLHPSPLSITPLPPKHSNTCSQSSSFHSVCVREWEKEEGERELKNFIDWRPIQPLSLLQGEVKIAILTLIQSHVCSYPSHTYHIYIHTPACTSYVHSLILTISYKTTRHV